MSVAWLSRFAILLACLGLSGCFPPQEARLDENKNPYLLEGKARVAARDYKGAIEAFEKALEVHPRAEQFLRHEGEWALRRAEGMGGTLSLPSLKATLQLSEVFAGVEF